jgi:hypothetical protein
MRKLYHRCYQCHHHLMLQIYKRWNGTFCFNFIWLLVSVWFHVYLGHLHFFCELHGNQDFYTRDNGKNVTSGSLGVVVGAAPPIFTFRCLGHVNPGYKRNCTIYWESGTILYPQKILPKCCNAATMTGSSNGHPSVQLRCHFRRMGNS